MNESIMELHLMQNDYNGCVGCSRTTSKLVSYKLIREDLNNQEILGKAPEIDFAGVYILVGTNDNGENIAYIGQSLNLLTRIKQPHDSIEDNWSVVILVTTNDNSFNATSISYIESKFIDEAKTAKRYILTNGNQPNNGNPTAKEKVTLNEYIANAKLYVQTLGYPIFIPLVKENDEKFYLKHNNGNYDAKGVYNSSNNHFIVLAGSKLQDKQPTAGTAQFVIDVRVNNKNKVNNFITTEDIEFSSPTVAASFIIGQNANGITAWKTKNGMTLKDYKER